MTCVSVSGAQWGDECKGAVIDDLSRDFDVTVRFQGGANAGHTLIGPDGRLVLHLIPSGVKHGKIAVCGRNLRIDPKELCEEFDRVRPYGSKIYVDMHATVVLEASKFIELGRERKRGDQKKIGTTGRAIGITTEQHYSRYSVTLWDMMDPDRLRQKLMDINYDELEALGQLYDLQIPSISDTIDYLWQFAPEIRPHLADTYSLMARFRREGKSILFELAQGASLDVDHGPRPTVTSSICTPHAIGVCFGGRPGELAERNIGVMKGYNTRVGNGPFPTECFNEFGTTLHRKGDERGATTGRDRRCGYFDAPQIRHNVHFAGFTELVMAKLDILSGMGPIPVCTEYLLDGKAVPPEATLDYDTLMRVQPRYEELPGWDEDLSEYRGGKWEDLPENPQKYVRRVEALVGTRISMIRVGAGRGSMIDVPSLA